LRRTAKYASGRLTNSSAWQESLLIRRDATLRISGALHLTIFEQPEKDDFFSRLLDRLDDAIAEGAAKATNLTLTV
jgi:hypothetical protein